MTMNFHQMNNVILALAISTGLISCNSQPEQNVSNQKNPGSANIELVNQYFEHFNNHDWTKMAEMYSETADFKDPSLGQGTPTHPFQPFA